MARPRVLRPALTQKAIEGAGPGLKRRYLWDGLVHGLGVVIQPSGEKTYVVQRTAGGRAIRRRLGSFSEMTLAEARRCAEEPLAAIRAGRNPNADIRAERAKAERERRMRITGAQLWDRYRLEIIGTKNRPRTAREKARMWSTKIGPVLGGVAVSDIDAEHIRQIVRGSLKVDANGRVTGGKAEAGNLYRLLKHMMRTAIRWRLRPPGSDPTAEVDQPRVNRRERLLSDDELGKLIGALETSEAPWQVRSALRFALLTGWRIGEVLSLRREYLQGSEAHLPDTKSGHSIRPLGREAVALLRALPRGVGSPWFFPAVRDGSKSLRHSTVAEALDQLALRAGVRKLSPHVLRHRVVTDIAGASPNIRTGMAVTGHKSVQAFMTYVHVERERAAAVADIVTGRLAGLSVADGGDSEQTAAFPAKCERAMAEEEGTDPAVRDLEGVPCQLVCDIADIEKTMTEGRALEARGAMVEIKHGDAAHFTTKHEELMARVAPDGQHKSVDSEREEWELIGDALDYAFATGRISGSIAFRLNKALHDALRGRPPRAWERRKTGQEMPEDIAFAVRAAVRYLDISREQGASVKQAKKLVTEYYGVGENRIKKWRRELNLHTAIDPSILVRYSMSLEPEGIRSFLADMGGLYRRWAVAAGSPIDGQ